MNAEKATESMSTQSKESKTCAKSLLKERYSEAEEFEKDEAFEWEDIGNGFFAVGTKHGPKTLCFGSDCVSGEKFKDARTAEAYVMKKPWPLIMMVAAIYTQRVNEIKNKK